MTRPRPDLVSRGVHAPADASAFACARAWCSILPDTGVITGLSAAELYGLWLPSLPDHPLFVAMGGRPGEVKPIHPGLYVSRHPTPPAQIRTEGLSLASGDETLLAAARWLGLLDLTVLVDSALTYAITDRARIARCVDRQRRGAPLLRQALALSDARSESPWETILRLFHVSVDVQVIPQREFVDDAGHFVARADLLLAGTRTIHEYDGAGHRDRETHVSDFGATGGSPRSATSAAATPRPICAPIPSRSSATAT